VNHDDRTNRPPEDDGQWSLEEIAGLFNEFAETIAEIVTPEDTESALQDLFDRIKSDQNNGADVGKPVQERQSPIPATKIGVNLVQGRDIGRAAYSTLEVLAPLAVSGLDLRMTNLNDREETRSLLAGARELLSSCPAGAFGAEDSAMILGTVATLAERLIADRDERAALSLVRVASRHLSVLDRHDPIAFEVRRVEAEALSELGQYQRAEMMLRRLADDEQRVGGAADPRTVLLLHWALVGWDRPFRAEEGYSSLEDHLKDAKRDPSLDRLLLHTRCRRAWVFLQLGRVEDSVSAYDQVISERTRVLGKGHTETLDARHSQLKALVTAGQFERALPLLKRLLDDRKDAQGADHPDTLETRKYYSVALALVELNDCALRDATGDLEEILQIQKKRLGLDHPMSRDTAEWRDRLLDVQADRDREQASLGHSPAPSGPGRLVVADRGMLSQLITRYNR
jgi:tetratricopeptide (TPR) repeat protein